jgi:hypothetical protein
MKYSALGTIVVVLALGLPTVSGGFLIGMVALSISAQADIACGRLGCRETGRTLRRNGSYYRGLGLPTSYHQADGNNPPKTDNKQVQPR